jgi:hypothetical protein
MDVMFHNQKKKIVKKKGEKIQFHIKKFIYEMVKRHERGRKRGNNKSIVYEPFSSFFFFSPLVL